MSEAIKVQRVPAVVEARRVPADAGRVVDYMPTYQWLEEGNFDVPEGSTHTIVLGADINPLQDYMRVKTLEEEFQVNRGDWVVRDELGYISVYSDPEFKQIYKEVSE